MTETWEARARAKRTETLAKIPLEWRLTVEQLESAMKQRDITGLVVQKHLSEHELLIVSQDSATLVERLQQGDYTAVQVTAAFCKAAAIAHQISNCLHEIFFDQALETAEYLDSFYALHKTTIGPLHGLPISLKDQFHVKGVDTTMGYVGWIGSNLGIKDPSQTHKVESQITAELLSLGAVLYCKTSVPQTLLLGETKNHIIGQVLNPHNRNLSCGGSSGGEGALQALRGSVLGVGTDVGGSVRIPAAFNGVYALKPSAGRLSYRNVANTNPGQTTYPSTVGFLSTSLEGLKLLLRSTLSTSPWLRDPVVLPLPFRQEIFDDYMSRVEMDGIAIRWKKPLKIGIMWTDNLVQPHPPITRGLRIAFHALRRAGHRVTDWDPPCQSEATRIHVSFIFADGAHDIQSHLQRSGEPLLPELEKNYHLRPPLDLLAYQSNTLAGIQYEEAYHDYWNQSAREDGQIVDAVIMPVAPHAAVIPGKYYHSSYTGTINLVNYSAAVLPVTKANSIIDVVDDTYTPRNEFDRKNWEAYDPDMYDGGPVGLQVVGRKFEEEKILAITRIISSVLDKYGVEDPPNQGA